MNTPTGRTETVDAPIVLVLDPAPHQLDADDDGEHTDHLPSWPLALPGN